eukprot:scaffold4030_cov263-Pinguiococcus_pyrenoidosus.AAC.1
MLLRRRRPSLRDADAVQDVSLMVCSLVSIAAFCVGVDGRAGVGHRGRHERLGSLCGVHLSLRAPGLDPLPDPV